MGIFFQLPCFEEGAALMGSSKQSHTTNVLVKRTGDFVYMFVNVCLSNYVKTPCSVVLVLDHNDVLCCESSFLTSQVFKSLALEAI